MWQSLTLYHLASPSPVLSGALVWRTCLRQILFVPPGEEPEVETQKLQGHEAYKFLTEICAGLHSPLIGETEVFGQFREFRKKSNFPTAWNSLLDAVEEDARKIRREFLTSLGPQNYGSLVRKHLDSNAIVLVGSGHLAKELLPWLSEHKVICYVRNKEKAQYNLPLETQITENPQDLPENAIWILAAPAENEKIIPLVKSAAKILDLRGEMQLPNCENYKSLSQLYAALSSSREGAESQKQLAMTRISSLYEQRLMSVLHRPYGWEDAFA